MFAVIVLMAGFNACSIGARTDQAVGAGRLFSQRASPGGAGDPAVSVGRGGDPLISFLLVPVAVAAVRPALTAAIAVLAVARPPADATLPAARRDRRRARRACIWPACGDLRGVWR